MGDLLMRRRAMMAHQETEDIGWTNGVAYDLNLVSNCYINQNNGQEIRYNNWSATDFLPVFGASYLIVKRWSNYSAWYKEDKSYLSSGASATKETVSGGYKVFVPAGAHYFRLSDGTSNMTTQEKITPYE